MATKNARSLGKDEALQVRRGASPGHEAEASTVLPTEYAVRPARTTVSTVADVTSRALDEAATRLRSWAATRGYLSRGRPFFVLDGSDTCRVFVPIDEEADPHPETGIVVGRHPDSAVACTSTMTRRAAEAALPGLLDVIGGLAAGPAEFHAGKDGFGDGTLQVPVLSDPSASGPPSSRTAA
jgi:hypothetical protein